MFAITHENGVETILHNVTHDLEYLVYNNVIVWQKTHLKYIMTYNVEADVETTLLASSDTNPGFTSDMVSAFKIDGVSTTFTKTYTFSIAGEHTVEMEINADNLATLPAYAFYSLGKLVQIEIPEGVTTIGNNAFEDCAHLTTVYVPTTTESFGLSVFEGCSELTTVTVK